MEAWLGEWGRDLGRDLHVKGPSALLLFGQPKPARLHGSSPCLPLLGLPLCSPSLCKAPDASPCSGITIKGTSYLPGCGPRSVMD